MEVITIFIDDVLLRYVDIFQILVGVGMRAQLVGNRSLLISAQSNNPAVDWPPLESTIRFK